MYECVDEMTFNAKTILCYTICRTCINYDLLSVVDKKCFSGDFFMFSKTVPTNYWRDKCKINKLA